MLDNFRLNIGSLYESLTKRSWPISPCWHAHTSFLFQGIIFTLKQALKIVMKWPYSAPPTLT